MIRAAALCLTVCATTAQADLTYQGLTLGQPLPASITPSRSTSHAGDADMTELPAAFQNLCTHTIIPNGAAIQAHLSVLTDRCDGPILLITASYVGELETDGFRPAPLPDPSLTDPALADLAFDVSTLEGLRAVLCSEGLISAPFFGQDTAYSLGTYSLAYEVEDTAALIFTLTLPRSLRLQPPESITADQRDTATLQDITLVIRPLIDLQLQEPPRPSPNYIPLPADIFDDAATLPDCAIS